eukprot:11902698-Ditylum_brightwellii.AAC.1
MPSMQALEDCDFSGSIDLGSVSGVTFLFEEEGIFYFGCEIGVHCSLGAMTTTFNVMSQDSET